MRPPAPLLLLLTPLLAGCVLPGGEGALPRIEISAEPDPVPADGALRVNLSLANTADTPFTFSTSTACVEWVAFTRAAGEAVFLERTDAPEVCAPVVTQHELAPGQSLSARFVLEVGALTQGGRPLFAPGAYPLTADLVAEEPSWDVSSTSSFTVGGASLPRITLSVDPEPIVRGEDSQITANFTNDSDRPYTYTSPDGCQTIDVWVDRDGERIELWPEDGPFACTAVLIDVTIPPGGSRQVTVTWDGSSEWGGDERLAPGGYTVHADFRAYRAEAEPAWDASGSRTVTLE